MHHSIRLTHCVYRGSLFLLILLAAAAIAVSAADVIIQALAAQADGGVRDYRNLIVVVVSYVVLAIFALSLSCSRALTVRSALQDIPKSHMPTTRGELPQKVYASIVEDFGRVQEVRGSIAPRPEDFIHFGWGQPGVSNLAGVNFKQAIVRTPAIIEQAAVSLQGCTGYARPMQFSTRQYIEGLIQRGLVDEQLGRGYVAGYEQARFSRALIGEERYLDIMKHLAAILRHMGYRLSSVGPSEGGSVVVDTPASRGPPGHPRDDDVASLAQSVGTLASRSTSVSHHRVWSSARIDEQDDRHHARQFVMARLAIDGVRPPF